MSNSVLLSSIFLSVSLFAVACTSSRPPSSVPRETQLAVVENSDGVEVQAPDPWRAEQYMRERCPRGFTVVRRQEVVAHLTQVSSDSFDHLGDPSELTGNAPITEQRTTFRCRPIESESGAVLSANAD